MNRPVFCWLKLWRTERATRVFTVSVIQTYGSVCTARCWIW